MSVCNTSSPAEVCGPNVEAAATRELAEAARSVRPDWFYHLQRDGEAGFLTTAKLEDGLFPSPGPDSHCVGVNSASGRRDAFVSNLGLAETSLRLCQQLGR